MIHTSNENTVILYIDKESLVDLFSLFIPKSHLFNSGKGYTNFTNQHVQPFMGISHLLFLLNTSHLWVKG